MKLIIKATSAIYAAMALGVSFAVPFSSTAADKAVVIKFPKSPIGRYGIVRNAPNPDDDVLLNEGKWATGDVRIPPGHSLSLSLNYNGGQNTQFIRGLPAGIIRSLTCRDMEINDQSVADLCTQKGLVSLNLQGVDLTDAGVKHLSPLKELRKLSICDTLVTAKGLDVLRNMPLLENLNLSRLALGEGIDAPLQPLKNLYLLELTGTQLTDKAVMQLPNFPRLRTLVLRRNNVTDKCIDSLHKYKNLQSLDLTDTHVTGEGLKRLKCLPRMHDVIIRINVLRAGDLAQLKRLMPRLKVREGSREQVVPSEIFAPLH